MGRFILGIIGGGQLGSMLSTAAKKIDIKTIVYCDDMNAPAQNFANEFIYGRYDDEKKINDAKNQFKITSDKLHIVLGVGGSGSTKRVTAEKFIKFMDLINEVKNCIFYLAAGSNTIEQQIVDTILNSTHKNNSVTLNKMDIVNTLPIIKNCDLAVCNDSSFSHISAALGIKTLVLMTDTPLLYGSYSSRMTAILPEGLKNVTHDTSAKEKINPEEIYIKAKKILNL